MTANVKNSVGRPGTKTNKQTNKFDLAHFEPTCVPRRVTQRAFSLDVMSVAMVICLETVTHWMLTPRSALSSRAPVKRKQKGFWISFLLYEAESRYILVGFHYIMLGFMYIEIRYP